MGQKTSSMFGIVLPFLSPFRHRHDVTIGQPQQPIKFQYRTHKHTNHKSRSLYSNQSRLRQPIRTRSESDLMRTKMRRCRRRCQQRRRSNVVWNERNEQFGYEIDDIDGFLTKATIEKPANIPIVLAIPTILYQTNLNGYQSEIQLPLGMVVNGVFKNQHWLYIQTPHAEEGYVTYTACLPLGIIPPSTDNIATPCWEDNTDIFPQPTGNQTDSEKLSVKSDYTNSFIEKNFDSLYLKTQTKCFLKQHTLLFITTNYHQNYHNNNNILNVNKGDVVYLIDEHLNGWYWVRNKFGDEGFIPSTIAAVFK